MPDEIMIEAAAFVQTTKVDARPREGWRRAAGRNAA
jgi:hypothetical protein